MTYNKTYSEFSVTSNAKYKDISSITFTPIKEIEAKLVIHKGDLVWWKLFGIIPILPYKARKNIYYLQGEPFKMSFYQIKRRYYYSSFESGDKVYRMARVVINNIVGSTQYEHFLSNEEAIKFIDDLKSKCKEAGNELQ